jgi:dihydroorotate dehydrogenase (NAD+) catalytic subunit
MSGPAIKPIAIRMVYQCANAVSIPIIGMGGIASAEDAIEFMMAGATAVQVGTANFADVYAMPRIIKEMDEWLNAHGIKDVKEIIDTVKLNG